MIGKNKGYKFSEEHRKKLSKAKKGLKGPKSNNWQGGLSSENHLIRNSAEFREWREKVFKKDNYTCQKCKKHGGNIYLHRHHIMRFAKYIKYRFIVEFCQTLCKECHMKLHKILEKVKMA